MAILLLENNMDEQIDYISNKIFEVEFLIEKAPGRLEAYGNTLNILKMIKRGISQKEAVGAWCSECCPPGKHSDEACQGQSCHACWTKYINELDPYKHTQ